MKLWNGVTCFNCFFFLEGFAKTKMSMEYLYKVVQKYCELI